MAAYKPDTLESILIAFGKDFAAKGKNRPILKEMKRKLHWEAIKELENVATSPKDIY